MIAKMLLGLVLIFPTLAHANGGIGHDCTVFDRDSRRCDADPSCQYDYNWQSCNDRWNGGGGGGGGSRECSAYDFDVRLCNQQSGCSYDQRDRRCVDDWNPGPGHNPQGCWDMNNDPYQCNQSFGCYYDNRSRTCQSDNGPGPGPGREVWECTAVDAGWEEHAGGHSTQGRSYQDAQWAAIELCEHYHGSCVIRNCHQVR